MPFLHLTTRIEGHPYQDLLGQKGGRGFPTLRFLDAAGEVLGEPSDRSVTAFEAGLDALLRIDGVRAKAEAGNAAAVTELLLLEHALGRVEPSLFGERAAMLTEVTAEQRTTIDQIIVDDRIWELVGVRDQAAQAEGLLELFHAGKRPSKAPKYAVNFWSILGRWGQSQGDAGLLRACAQGIAADLADNENMLRYADSLLKNADGLDRRDALRARLADGETGLEAQILLLDYELRAIDPAGYRAALPAALAVATPEQKEQLLQAEVDLEVETLWRQASLREPGSEDHGKRLLVLLFGDGRKPSDSAYRQGISIAARWADRNLDQVDDATLIQLTEALRETFSSYEYWLKAIERYEAILAERAAVEPTSGN